VGGGYFYGREGVQWSEAINYVINDCWARENLTDYHNYDCSPWQIEEGVLASNRTSGNKTYTASLTFSMKLVKPGNFSLKYRKDTVRLNGRRVGTFMIAKNNERILEDNEIDQSNWKTFVVSLEVGTHEVSVDYLTQRIDDIPYPKAYIAHVQVVGTKFSDSECYKCPYGGNNYGSTTCGTCDFNEYLKDDVCTKCPNNTYSYKGAASLEACLPKYPCSENDYKPIYSSCQNGKREKSYVYRDPIFCDVANAPPLPESSQVDCEPCKPGYLTQNFSGSISCQACPPGSFLESGMDQCNNCSAGRYARRQMNITDWSDIPEKFSTYCLKYDGSLCLHSSGWIPATSYLTTGLNKHRDSEIFLNRYVKIEGNFGFVKVDYRFVTDANGFLDVYVDREFYETWNSSNRSPSYIYLNKGSHYVQLVYWNILGKQEELRIYSIKIHGSDEGAAARCIECEDGSISEEGQSVCTPCPAGTSSNLEKNKCVECSVNFYSNLQGSKCIRCPTGTQSNKERTNCIGISYVYFNSSSYFIENITGTGINEGVYVGGICNMPSAKLYCHQTFYGPLPGYKKDFYISVLNPSHLELPYGEYVSSNSTSFAFFVTESQDVDQCVVKKRIHSLGKVVSQVKTIKNGFSVKYSLGDECVDTINYNAQIDFLCDKSTGIGWPAFESEDECQYKFKWVTKYGCPICMYHQMKAVKSQCVDGVRTVKKVETESCILPYDETIEWNEECSVLDEIIYEWPMIVGFSLLGLLIVLVVISVLVYCKYKRGYDRLQEISDKV
jgi:hypothetical protein